MSKDINDILKEINKNHKEIYQVDTKLNKEVSYLGKELTSIKKEVGTILSKLDIILEMLMTLTLFIEESVEIGELDDDNEEDYESNEGWIPDNEEWRESLEDEDLNNE